MARILGVHQVETDHFAALVYSSARLLDAPPPTVESAAAADLDLLLALLDGALERRFRTSWIDFLSGYLAQIEPTRDSAFARRAQIASVALSVSATARAALTRAVVCVLSDRQVWAALCADPAGVKAPAAQEALRLRPPVSWTSRLLSRPVAFDGAVVPEGSVVHASVFSALRDPAVFAHPERFDLRRVDHPTLHPGFGGWANPELSEALARVMVEEALEAFASAFGAAVALSPDAQLGAPVLVKR